MTISSEGIRVRPKVTALRGMPQLDPPNPQRIDRYWSRAFSPDIRERRRELAVTPAPRFRSVSRSPRTPVLLATLRQGVGLFSGPLFRLWS
jgi:hypothetical protein